MVQFTILKQIPLLKKLTNAELVRIIHLHHHKWLMQVAFNLTQDTDNAEDLIQEVYVYLMEMKDIEKIRYNNTVNLFYIYKTIKSKFLNSIKQSKKITILPIDEDFLEIEDLEYNIEKDEEFEVMLKQTKHLLENEVLTILHISKYPRLVSGKISPSIK